MNIPLQPDQELEQRLASPLLDVLIRAGLILAMAMLCYQVLSPFLTLMVWALILAVTLYPLHQAFASKIRGQQGLAATLLVVVGINDPQRPPLKNGSRPKAIANTRFSARANVQAPPGSRVPSTSAAAVGKDALPHRRV
jgi:hypothetical protein